MSSSNSIFIFGDSQTEFGLDLKELNNKTNYKIHSASKSGAGIYDFFVFVNKIPNNSKVILSISKLAQIRPDINESNTSPLNLNAFFDAYSLGYSRLGLSTILKRNLKLPINKYYTSDNALKPNLDTITENQNLEIFENRYSTSKKYLIMKQGMYLNRIKELIKKNCHITFVEFPIHPTLMELDNNYKYQNYFSKFKEEISSYYTEFKIDTIQLPKDKNLMYDYSHLNKNGANLLTNTLAERINKNKSTTWYMVMWRDSDKEVQNF